MWLRPSNRDELARQLAEANSHRARLEGWDLTALARVLAYQPEDLTITVEAGITLGALQAQTARNGQWIPLDPAEADSLTIEQLLAQNRSGPRRCGYGLARDHLLGLRAALPDGRIVHSGAQVVKNVAGYDLHKLFVGAHGSLGIVVEATFKLMPLPETEQFWSRTCPNWEDAARSWETLRAAPIQPVVWDLHGQTRSPQSPTLTYVVGVAGAREDVEAQGQTLQQAGFQLADGTGYDRVFELMPGAPPPRRSSVLPTRLIETLAQLGPATFVARAANGAIRYRLANPASPGLPVPEKASGVAPLAARVKSTFDPHGILPPLPA